MTGIKKWVKVAVWIFKKQDIFRLKNVKIKKFHKIHEDFSDMLRDDMLSKGSKTDFFSFFRTNLIMFRELHFGHLSGTRLTSFIFLVSLLCFP